MNLSPELLRPILVVDDSPEHLFLTQRLLLKSGTKFPILAFESAAPAISYLSAAEEKRDRPLPCIVLTDIKMSEISGFEFVRWLRGKDSFSQVPVVMLSSSNEPKDIEECKNSGANRLVVKYPSVDEMHEILRMLGVVDQVVGEGSEHKTNTP